MQAMILKGYSSWCRDTEGIMTKGAWHTLSNRTYQERFYRACRAQYHKQMVGGGIMLQGPMNCGNQTLTRPQIINGCDVFSSSRKVTSAQHILLRLAIWNDDEPLYSHVPLTQSSHSLASELTSPSLSVEASSLAAVVEEGGHKMPSEKRKGGAKVSFETE